MIGSFGFVTISWKRLADTYTCGHLHIHTTSPYLQVKVKEEGRGSKTSLEFVL